MALEKDCPDKIDILELVDGDKPLHPLVGLRHILHLLCLFLVIELFFVQSLYIFSSGKFIMNFFKIIGMKYEFKKTLVLTCFISV